MITRFLLLLILTTNCAAASPLAPIDVLYHGSPNPNIRIFEPRAENIRHPDEGNVVFASPSIRFASCYLFRWDDSWVHQFIGDNGDIYMVIANISRFRENDKGGSIYLMPIKGFVHEKDKGLGVYEWTNKSAVTPYGKINFLSALGAMKEFGVKVYFIDDEQFRGYLGLDGAKQESFLHELKSE